MSQDIVADGLNVIMNAKKARKTKVVLTKYSKVLRHILDLAKEGGLLDYEVDGTKLKVEIKDLNMIRSIKPRYTVKKDNINFYVRRYLPAKDFGIILISTPKGIMTHLEAKENNMGGKLLAYCY